MNKKAGLHEFVEGMEMTVLSSEDQVLLDGMVGTSGSNISIWNCCPISNNCQGGNCAKNIDK